MLSGLMQQVPLTLNLVRERVTDLYPAKTVTTRYTDGIHVITFADLLDRAGRIANFLQEIGISRGTRVATLAWNSHRHLELYIAVPCMGAVLHTINARLLARAAGWSEPCTALPSNRSRQLSRARGVPRDDGNRRANSLDCLS